MKKFFLMGCIIISLPIVCSENKLRQSPHSAFRWVAKNSGNTVRYQEQKTDIVFVKNNDGIDWIKTNNLLAFLGLSPKK